MDNQQREDKKNTKPTFISQYIHKRFYRENVFWLDCASGDGYTVADFFLQRINPHKYFCIDNDAEKIKRLSRKGCQVFNIDLEITDMKTIIPNKVDVVLSIETLEHLEEHTAIRVVDDFISLLKVKGMMCISFPIMVSFEKPLNKHQPNINRYKEYSKYFSSFSVIDYKKSHFLFFGDKKE